MAELAPGSNSIEVLERVPERCVSAQTEKHPQCGISFDPRVLRAGRVRVVEVVRGRNACRYAMRDLCEFSLRNGSG